MVFQEDMTTGGGGHGDKKEDQGEDNEIPLHELPIDSESKLSSFFSTRKKTLGLQSLEFLFTSHVFLSFVFLGFSIPDQT